MKLHGFDKVDKVNWDNATNCLQLHSYVKAIELDVAKNRVSAALLSKMSRPYHRCAQERPFNSVRSLCNFLHWKKSIVSRDGKMPSNGADNDSLSRHFIFVRSNNIVRFQLYIQKRHALKSCMRAYQFFFFFLF